jgi:hypothetical protein
LRLKVQKLRPQADGRVQLRIGAAGIGAQVDQILRALVRRHGLSDLDRGIFLFGTAESGRETAHRLQNVDGRVVARRAQLARKNNVAVQDGAHRVADRLIEIIAFH